jgi:hypothetical protein
MINNDIFTDVFAGGGAGVPAVSLPVTTPATPSTPVPAPTTAPGVPGGAMATRPSMSIYDVFKTINNKTNYGASSGGVPLVQAPNTGGYSGTSLASIEQLMNPVSGTTQVSRSLQQLLNPNSAYIQNARQRGAEQAQARGGINSSIAAGASERAAMEAVQPLVQQAVDVDQQKYKLLAEDYLAQQGYKAQSALADKSGALQMALAQQQANSENWLSEQNFGRAMFGQTFANSIGMLNMVQQYGLEDPELYTPEVLSGYTNFFQQNMNDLLSRYFGG